MLFIFVFILYSLKFYVKIIRKILPKIFTKTYLNKTPGIHNLYNIYSQKIFNFTSKSFNFII